MGMREILKGTVIYESGQKLNGLMMIMRGTAVVSFEGGSYELHSGDWSPGSDSQGGKFPICGEGESGSCGLSIKGAGAEEVF